MALKSTVFRLSLTVSDLDRNHYADYDLTLARHPSETDERMMVRVLTFALHACQDLRFGRGLSTDDEPALWEVDPTGQVMTWIEVGLPDEDRIRKACSRARRTVVVAYGGRAVDVWWQQLAGKLERHERLTVIRLPEAASAGMCGLVERSMRLTCTIQDGTLWLSSDALSVEIAMLVLKPGIAG
ncbi:MAG: YaeQ family protein [Rhodocyclaceae bacterium]